MKENRCFFSIATRSGLPAPTKCSCPTTPSRLSGRIRAANGSMRIWYSLNRLCVFIVPSSNLFSKQMMSHARSAWWLETKSYARIVPPLPRFTLQPQKEKMFLAFRICARPIFSENGKDIFLFGVLPSKYSGRWRNNADEVLAKLFFGERICQNFD